MTPFHFSNTMNDTETSRLHVGAKFVSWVQIGDLHITTAEQQNYRDLQSIVRDLNFRFGGKHGIDFVFLPGDNADNGTDVQYDLVTGALSSLVFPLHVIPGDHDAQSGNLDAFRRAFPQSPPSWFVKPGYRFIFLNSVNTPNGKGFDLGRTQLAFVETNVAQATRAGETVALFMHTYPSELSCAPRIKELLSSPNIKLVAMGHTHYNEVANDGSIIYTATRSTGQIEEGPVGFSVTCLYNDTVSWKFRELADNSPFVMIVSPSDAAFTVGNKLSRQAPVEIRAKVWDSGLVKVASLQIDGGEKQFMYLDDIGGFLRFDCDLGELTPGVHTLTVTAVASDGRYGEDTIDIWIGDTENPPRIGGKALDVHNVISANTRKGLLGTQLGPNKNGHPW